jgi:hypothetical protein
LTSGTDVGAAGEPTRATGPSRTRTQPEAVVDTAEIQRVGPSRPRRISSPYDHVHEEPERRAPAPMGLQIAVWLLFVIFVIGLVALAVEHFHPSWIANLRNTVGSPSTRTHHHANGTSSSSTSNPSTHPSVLTETSSNAKGATYSVPTSSSYTLVVAVPNRCYIDVTQPPNSRNYVFAATVAPSQSPKSIAVNGPSTLELGAQTTSVIVKVAGKQVGDISAPKAGYIYTFLPSKS